MISKANSFFTMGAMRRLLSGTLVKVMLQRKVQLQFGESHVDPSLAWKGLTDVFLDASLPLLDSLKTGISYSTERDPFLGVSDCPCFQPQPQERQLGHLVKLGIEDATTRGSYKDPLMVRAQFKEMLPRLTPTVNNGSWQTKRHYRTLITIRFSKML